MNVNRRIIYLPLALLLLISSLLSAGCDASTSQEQATPTPIPAPIVPVKPTYTVMRGEIEDKLQFSGRVAPIQQESLFFRTAGRVGEIHFEQGDPVSAGDVLAELEGLEKLERQLALDQLALQRAETQMEITQRNLEIAKKTLNRWSQTYEDEVAIKDLELELAKIALEEVRLNTLNVEEAITESRIVAPFDGIVLKLSISDGKEIDAYRSAIVVADVSGLEVVAELDHDELEVLEESMPVEIEPYGNPGEMMGGFIRLLPFPYGSGNKDNQDDASVIEEDVNVHIATDQTLVDAGLELGDLMRITVILEHKPDVLWLPVQAIRTFENRKFVLIQDGDVQRRLDVVIGIQSDDRVEIETGLEEGQVVIGP